MRVPRDLLEDCCGWNRKLWADALEFAVWNLPEDIAGKRVLEVGASRYSSIAPVFASQGANVVCSHYGQTSEEIERGQLGFVIRRYGLGKIPIVELDINDLDVTYDIIALKSVLGGLCRGGDYQRLGTIIDELLRHIEDDGFIVTLDNGYVALFEKLRKIRGAGGSNWGYFKEQDFVSALAHHDIRLKGFGFMNFGAATFLFKRDLEIVNDMMYLLDKVLLRVVKPNEHAVLATVIAKRTV
jgi:hypothetical protein